MDIERKRLYFLPELSELLGVSVRTLQRLVAEGDIMARRLGGRIVVRGEDLLDGLPDYVPGEGLRRKRKGGGEA